jgi:hypothetical protein|tara:strand:- start:16076 stop:16477 length:402 start_codon:yes stop_codon:yes gene_type:complete
MGLNIKRSNADVGGGKASRHPTVRQSTHKHYALNAARGAAHTPKLWAIADENRLDVIPSTTAQTRNRTHKVNSAMPRSKGPSKDDDRVSSLTLKRYIAPGFRSESGGIGTPFKPDYPVRLNPLGQDTGTRRDK